MVQEEQGVILKVNKQKRQVVEVLSLLSSQHTGMLGEGNVGFSNPSASDGFTAVVCLTNMSSV